MSGVTQRGMLLLPVALTLALVATLAYTMTREGSMSAAEVDAQYDLDVATYLAAGGVQLAKWQNEKLGCDKTRGFTKLRLPGGTISSAVSAEKSDLEISVTADTGRTTYARPTVKLTHYDATQPSLTVIATSDTSIVKGVFSSQAGEDRLETTDGTAHALLKFGLSKDDKKALDKALLISTQLKLVHAGSNARTYSLGVHRVTKTWGDNVLWSSPSWTTPGGDYAPVATAVVAIDGSTFPPTEYSWRIDPLLDLWLANDADNLGVLLKPVGALDAKFYSLDSFLSLLRPRLVARYYPRCP